VRPAEDLSNAITEGIARIRGAAPKGVSVEPFLVQRFGQRSVAGKTLDPEWQWHWGDIHLVDAWSYVAANGTSSKGDPPPHVAVIDFGFDLMEPQLYGQKAWTGYFRDNAKPEINGAMPLSDDHGTFCAGLVGAVLD